MEYAEYFKKATGFDPFDYQNRLASMEELPQLIDIPTGCGKTAASVLSGSWRRRKIGDRTPGRGVYGLHLSMIEDQTRNGYFMVVAC